LTNIREKKLDMVQILFHNMRRKTSKNQLTRLKQNVKCMLHK
jgi:hypothetical protein